MAPGLVSGDIVASGRFPFADRLRERRRFDRWIVGTPDGGAGIKRLVGLPGERLSIEAGDLWIDGQRLLTPPAVLAQVAAAVPAAQEHRPDGSIRLEPHGPVLDDAAFAPGERRLLLPVRDIGIVAVVGVDGTAAGRVTLLVGDRAARFTPQGRGRFGLVAGRLDGRFVATAWPLAPGGEAGDASRDCLPSRAPEGWAVASPWAGGDSADEPSPRLECRIEPGCTSDVITIVALSVWRDVLYRPAADGNVAWRLGPGEVFLLGDFSSGSRDSRHWGPIGADRLLQRVTSVVKAAPDTLP